MKRGVARAGWRWAPTGIGLLALLLLPACGGGRAPENGEATCGPDEHAVGAACVPTAFDEVAFEPVSLADFVADGERTFLKGRLLVGLRDETTPPATAAALFAAHGGSVDGAFPAVGLYRVRFADAADFAALDERAAELMALPEVEFTLRAEVFDDPAAAVPEREKNTDNEKITAQAQAWRCSDATPTFAAIGADGLWAYTRTGVMPATAASTSSAWDAIYRANPVLTPVVVGVVDTPTETRIFGTLPLVGYSDVEWVLSEGQEISSDPHGTLVSAVIGAPSNADGMNGILAGLACVPYDLSPQGVIGKWIDASKTRSRAGIEAVIIGIAKAVRSGARVVNLSLGARYYEASQAEQLRIVAGLYAKIFAKAPGVLFVAAAGNDGKEAAKMVPAAAAATALNAMAVAAVGRDDRAAVWRVGRTNVSPGVTLAAPGSEVLTTDPNGSLVLCEGTSLAAPVVSGVAGLLFAINPKLTGAEARQILVRTADPIGDTTVSGLRLNAGRAVADVIAALPADKLGKGTCRPPDEQPPPAGAEPACPIGDDYCSYCSGPEAGPVDFTVPGAAIDYPRAHIEIGWSSATALSNFEVSVSDPASGAWLETNATNIATATPGTGNTNIASLTVTRQAVTITLTKAEPDSALGAGYFGASDGDYQDIRTLTATMTFSGETVQVQVHAEGWDGVQATAAFTGVYQLSDFCPAF